MDEISSASNRRGMCFSFDLASSTSNPPPKNNVSGDGKESDVKKLGPRVSDEVLFERGRRHSLDKDCDDGLDVIVKKSITLTSTDIQQDDKI